MYIAGGFNGDVCLRSAEVYDPTVDQWTMIQPMSITRSGVAVCVYNGSLYAVGGFDGESRLKSGIQLLNPQVLNLLNIMVVTRFKVLC